MQYEKELRKIWKVIFPENSLRPAAAQLDVDKNTLTATEGHALAVWNVGRLIEAGEKSFLIPAAAFKAADAFYRKQAKFHLQAKPIYIRQVKDGVKVSVGKSQRAQFFDSPVGVFPDWESIIPADLSEYQSVVTLDPDLLNRLVRAIKDNGYKQMSVQLYIKNDRSPIVLGLNGSTYAVMMPARNEHPKPTAFWRTPNA